MKRLFYILTLLTFVTACSEDEWSERMLTPEQQTMIGSAVSFEMSMADPFDTRTTYNRNGSFNQGDLMMIYRQYEENGKFDWQNEIFRAYDYTYQTAPGTDIWIKRDWSVCSETEGNKIARQKGDYKPSSDKRSLSLSPQTEADSLTWENGKTVRFRAWSRSNLVNAITNKSKDYYYPDFCISDWVTVSGPTEAIPLNLKHLGCRITVFYKDTEGAGNRLKKVEVATDAADYAREDNADCLDNDAADKTIKDAAGNVLSAEQAAANVKEAFEKMSMPAGVDIETGLLRAMTQTAYKNTTDFRTIEEWEYTEEGRKNYVSFGDLSSAGVKTTVQHPVFAYNDARYCIVTIPYNISSDHGGEPITLPPYTRFKIWLHDVNGASEYESNYHIFSLSDVKKEGVALYPNGLELMPGYSYEFKVGYRYDHMTITPGDSFSWEQQDAENETGQSTEDVAPVYTANSYSWWKNAIKKAVNDAQNNENFNPEFHISSVEEFLEFIKLVNGDAARPGVSNGKIYHLVKEYETITNPNGTVTKKPKVYGWSTVDDEKKPQWVEKSTLEAQGYVFYEHYHPSDANKEAYSEEDYLQTPFSFYDEQLSRHFTVYLDCDLDFKDKKISSIGRQSVTLVSGATPLKAYFMGYFDGYSKLASESAASVHTLKNLNVEGNYLFDQVSDAAIRNLKIETTHTIGLLNTAVPTMNSDLVVGWGCYIAGISIKANNKPVVVSATETRNVNAIARSLTGPSVVVGCIHEGDATGPLVGAASDLRMYGCMRTASNISGAALLGQYLTTAPGYKPNFFAPQISFSNQKSTKNFSKKAAWGNFMCNYYNRDEHEDSKTAVAVGSTADDYSVLEYIRGRKSRILRAVYDNLLSREVPLTGLTDQQIEEYYGLAPWKAMNYAIYRYNNDDRYQDHPCKIHFEVSEIGYDHLYPQMKSGAPSDKWSSTVLSEWDILKLNN